MHGFHIGQMSCDLAHFAQIENFDRSENAYKEGDGSDVMHEVDDYETEYAAKQNGKCISM